MLQKMFKKDLLRMEKDEPYKKEQYELAEADFAAVLDKLDIKRLPSAKDQLKDV
ncbi:MAG: hypothetical protein AAB739_01250 [Patescibacteria group bacterium]